MSHDKHDTRRLSLSTRLLHSGSEGDIPYGAMQMPIYQTTAFAFETCAGAADLFSLQSMGHVYGRTSNPTNAALEQRLVELEGGSDAVSVASGKAAIMLAVLALAGAGDNIVASRMLYGGTYSAFTATLAQMGIEVRFVDTDHPDQFVAATDQRTRLFYGESLSNPTLHLFPIAAVAAAGAKIGVPLIIDNTLTPSLLAPISEGATASVVSCSKYIAGHGAVLGGALVVSGAFDWNMHTDRFPLLTAPDPAYGGEVWARASQRLNVDAMALRARFVILRDLGATLSPHSAFLIAQGMETLTLRMQRHSSSAAEIAAWLTSQPSVLRTTYPGISGPRPIGLSLGAGGMIGIELEGGVKAGQLFVDNLRLFSCVANNGDTRSLAIHPASTMLAQLTDQQRKLTGVPDGYVRLCIGLEDPADLKHDLSQALSHTKTYS